MIRAWLAEIREKELLTQKGVSEQTGITQQFYNYIENGERRPSPEVAERLASVLNFEKYGYEAWDLLKPDQSTA